MIVNSYINNNIGNIKFGNKKAKPINIARFQNIDNILYRGAKPEYEDIKRLKEIGIDTIIDFTTGYGNQYSKADEKAIIENLGMNYIDMAFLPFRNPSDEDVNKFFETMQQARKENKKVFIHCREGKDRTGLFAAMYKLKYNIADLSTCIHEMIEMGHDSLYYPNLIDFLKKFYYGLQPDLNKQPSCIINKIPYKKGNKKS